MFICLSRTKFVYFGRQFISVSAEYAQRCCAASKVSRFHSQIIRTISSTNIKDEQLEHCLLQQQRRVAGLSLVGVGQNTNTCSEKKKAAIDSYLRLIRFDRPIGTWLLFWPCSWGLAIAAPAGSLPDLWMLGLFGLGALLMRGSACIVNDMLDRDFDRQVERTRNRPLASGELSFENALIFLGGNLGLALLVLLQFNLPSIIFGASSLFLAFPYALFKRFTYYPQIVNGLIMSWGIPLAYTAIHGSIDLATVGPLYLSGVIWSVIYDTIYAHQDKADDKRIGVKSTALKFGENTQNILFALNFCMVSSMVLSGMAVELSWPFYTGVAVAGVYSAKQILSVDINNPADCFSKFKANVNLGVLVFFSILMGNLLKPKECANKTH